MSDHEILELLLKEIYGMKEDMSGMKEDISGMKTKIDKMDERLIRVETKLDHTIEEVAYLRQDVTGLQSEQKESYQALAAMYGQHEVELLKLKRRSV